MRIARTHPCERVLIVNDDQDMLDTMKDVLEMDGATARTATSWREAFAILESGFDASVVVLDVRLGDGQRGDRLADRLKSDPRFNGIPVVLMSGDIHELRRVGPSVDATLVKPFAIETLHAVLTDLCAEASA